MLTAEGCIIKLSRSLKTDTDRQPRKNHARSRIEGLICNSPEKDDVRHQMEGDSHVVWCQDDCRVVVII